MISALRSSSSAKDSGHSNLVLKPLKTDFNARYLAYSPDPSPISVRNSLTDISNTMHRLPTTDSVMSTPTHGFTLLSHSRTTMRLGHVATMNRHDTDAWSQERKVQDADLHAVADSSSLGSNGIIPADFPINGAKSHSFALVGLQAEEFWTMERFHKTGQLREDPAVYSHDKKSLVPFVQPNVVIGPCSHEDPSGGRYQVSEILVHCGVISASGISSMKSTAVDCCPNSDARPADNTSSVTMELPFSEDDGLFMTALADWTSEWVHTLVIRPYQNFRFQFQGKPSRATASIASRIRRVLNIMENPVQVVIHALWLIGVLTGNGACGNAPFLSVPVFRYLHDNGVFFAEDFMFRTFVTCAMIGDKTVNDATLSANIWNHQTHIPQVILNATEKYALSCLKWNVVMTQIQWQDTITYLRCCIKMGPDFDPFSYDKTSSSGVMAHYLDELINLDHANAINTSQQEVPAVPQRSTYWEAFDTAEWCPEDDPVINWRPRTIGIAPGADERTNAPEYRTSAKDLLDSILGSSDLPDLTHLAQPTGTSFCGSFGVIGARLAHTIRIASACQSTSWVSSHG